MESKLNFMAIDAYVEKYSDKLCEELFHNTDSISGDEILKLPVNQVGLLVINNIFQIWNDEVEKLKSPYFNYNSEEVKAGVNKFMNLLSKNILVSGSDFKPLLRTAVRDTLLLMISPYSYYKSMVEQKATIELTYLESASKFVKINNECLLKMIDKAGEDTDRLNNPEELLNMALGSMESSPENVEVYIKKFSEQVPLEEESFYLNTDEPVDESSLEPLARQFDDDDEEEERTEGTINDSFIADSYESVADELKNTQQTNSLKSMLSINQKFMFINDLFNESQEDFSKVLDFLESCESKEVATSFIHNNYLKHNIWKVNSPQVKEFMSLLDKKFDKA